MSAPYWRPIAVRQILGCLGGHGSGNKLRDTAGEAKDACDVGEKCA